MRLEIPFLSALSAAFAVGLGWVLGSFIGSFIQWVLNHHVINPLIEKLFS